MKKLYIQPTLDVIALRPMHLMAGSETAPISNETRNASIGDARAFSGGLDDFEENDDF